MKRLIQRLSEWWRASKTRRSVAHLDRKIDNLQAEIQAHVTKLERKERDLANLHEESQTLIRNTKKTLESSSEEIEHLRSAKRILEDTMVPMLVAANNKAIAMWDAEIAIQTRRQVAAAVPQEQIDGRFG